MKLSDLSRGGNRKLKTWGEPTKRPKLLRKGGFRRRSISVKSRLKIANREGPEALKHSPAKECSKTKSSNSKNRLSKLSGRSRFKYRRKITRIMWLSNIESKSRSILKLISRFSHCRRISSRWIRKTSTSITRRPDSILMSKRQPQLKVATSFSSLRS